MASEFNIIEQHFSNIGQARDTTLLGVGDDAAVVDLPAGRQLVVSMDTLVGGVHFPLDTSPADIAYKALAVNLSDLAAMGANPAWFLLSLTIDDDDNHWLSRFANGLKQSADSFGVQLIGGDTCRGPLSISIQVAGTVPIGRYVTRAGARPGDILLVSGELGNAALGLAHKNGTIDLPQALAAKCTLALNRPRPRLELIAFLREFATAAIDISDGLVGDLKHILEQSDCGAKLAQVAVPVDPWLRQQDDYAYALEAGDDYEICCTVAAECRADIDAWNRDHPQCQLTPIGEITSSGYFLRDGERLIDLARRGGYRHFG
jgi:thiamine-monophosphate kinase